MKISKENLIDLLEQKFTGLKDYPYWSDLLMYLSLQSEQQQSVEEKYWELKFFKCLMRLQEFDIMGGQDTSVAEIISQTVNGYHGDFKEFDIKGFEYTEHREPKAELTEGETPEWFQKNDAEIVQQVFKDRHLHFERSSIEHYLSSGTVSGSFMQLILKCMEQKASSVHLSTIKAKMAVAQEILQSRQSPVTEEEIRTAATELLDKLWDTPAWNDECQALHKLLQSLPDQGEDLKKMISDPNTFTTMPHYPDFEKYQLYPDSQKIITTNTTQPQPNPEPKGEGGKGSVEQILAFYAPEYDVQDIIDDLKECGYEIKFTHPTPKSQPAKQEPFDQSPYKRLFEAVYEASRLSYGSLKQSDMQKIIDLVYEDFPVAEMPDEFGETKDERAKNQQKVINKLIAELASSKAKQGDEVADICKTFNLAMDQKDNRIKAIQSELTSLQAKYDKDIEDCFFEAREIGQDWKNHPISFNEWKERTKAKQSL